MKNKGLISRCVKVLLILMLVLNVTTGCSMKKITREQADSLLLEYCDILQEKAKTYGGTISFNPIENYDEYRIIRGEFPNEDYSLDVELYCRYREKCIHYEISNTYGINFSQKNIVETRKIMLDFVNKISVRQYTDSQLQEFMDDALNVTCDDEVALIKEKFFDFSGYEMFFYKKIHAQPEINSYEVLSIMGKTKNFR